MGSTAHRQSSAFQLQQRQQDSLWQPAVSLQTSMLFSSGVLDKACPSFLGVLFVFATDLGFLRGTARTLERKCCLLSVSPASQKLSLPVFLQLQLSRLSSVWPCSWQITFFLSMEKAVPSHLSSALMALWTHSVSSHPTATQGRRQSVCGPCACPVACLLLPVE